MPRKEKQACSNQLSKLGSSFLREREKYKVVFSLYVMDPHYKMYLDSIYKSESSAFFRKTNCGRPCYQDRNGPAHVKYENEEESPCATNPRKRKVNNDWNDLLNDSELDENYRNFLKCLRYPSNEEGITTFCFNNNVSFKCERGRRKKPIIEEQEEDSGADISDDDEGNGDDETGNEENKDGVYDDGNDTDIDDSDNVESIDVDDDSEDNIDIDDENEEKQEDTDISSDAGNEDGIDVEEETDIDNEDDADEINVTEDEEEEDDDDDDEEGEDEAYSCSEKSSRISISSTEYSSFEARLKKETKRPFNQYEHDRLMRKATERKAIVKDRRLRSGAKTYQTNVVGKSYFDHFPDLKAKVLAANKSRALELLRGFFFWLQNLCHEGSYQPWVCQPRVKRNLSRYK